MTVLFQLEPPALFVCLFVCLSERAHCGLPYSAESLRACREEVRDRLRDLYADRDRLLNRKMEIKHAQKTASSEMASMERELTREIERLKHMDGKYAALQVSLSLEL